MTGIVCKLEWGKVDVDGLLREALANEVWLSIPMTKYTLHFLVTV